MWPHVVHRIPLRYEAPLWSVVFPLGMYGVGSQYFGQTDHLPVVNAIGANESWVALTAWTLTFVAMLAHLAQSLAGVSPLRDQGARISLYRLGFRPIRRITQIVLPEDDPGRPDAADSSEINECLGNTVRLPGNTS